jgi:hypothetical protein
MVSTMLRPSNSLLGSSRAARRASVRAERMKALSGFTRWARGAVAGTISGLFSVGLVLVLPFLYLAAAYLAIDLPLRWMFGREATSWKTLLLFFASVALGLLGLVRAIQQVPPLAPVRPQFARAMYALAWLAGILMTIGDFAS